MVSLRRRKLLGHCSGTDPFPVELINPPENVSAVGNPNQSAKSISAHSLPSVDFCHSKPINLYEARIESSVASGCSSSKEVTNHYFPALPFPGKEIKRRKRHKRKRHEDQEPCLMRGVYYKNMKWQAAIKVDKKQIHLGTVGSQEEAAKLYDRAAFMCGREPNFELSEKEKQELSQYKWEDFLTMTRNDISSKKQRKRLDGGRRKKPETRVQSSDWEQDRGRRASSMSDDGDAETSVS